MPRYAKCDVMSGRRKKFKLKYLFNKTLERKSTKKLVLHVLKGFFHIMHKKSSFHKHFNVGILIKWYGDYCGKCKKNFVS